MIFNILLYAALIICITGTGIRLYSWVKKRPLLFASDTPGSAGVLKRIRTRLFSRHIIICVRSFFTDVLLQRRIIQTSIVRWTMHGLIFTGFIALVLMHAMDSLITEQLFPYYYSTINPFFFLRSLFGLMVLAGIGIAVFRRYVKQPNRLRNAPPDLFLIVLIAVIILSGVLLEGMKMASVTEFTVMVEDYAGLSYEDEDVAALEAFWVKEFALTSARAVPPFDPDTIALGMEVHESSCMDCHSPNRSAFLGYAAAKLLSPVAVALDRMKMVDVFYYFHILACFIGLALIPFSKMFHMVATPASLLANAVNTPGAPPLSSPPAKQRMELDACTHCCTCNLHCSAGMIRERVPNEFILPSEKMQALKQISQGKTADNHTLSALFQGIYLCTSCDRCTVSCPSGIHIKAIWQSAKENLARRRPDDTLAMTGFSFHRRINRSAVTVISDAVQPVSGTALDHGPIDRSTPLALGPINKTSRALPDLPSAATFSHCFGCQNCSTICPVVAQFDTPEETLTLLPHQIMYTLGLGLTDMARDAAMIWNCLSCYQCQEHCPQNVGVCDLLFLLKNQTFTFIQDGNV